MSKLLFRFVKERGDLEKEYARGLRKLVSRLVWLHCNTLLILMTIIVFGGVTEMRTTI